MVVQYTLWKEVTTVRYMNVTLKEMKCLLVTEEPLTGQATTVKS